MTTITTELLLTTPVGFALDTASPVQRARCRIGDGLPLGELATDPDVVTMLGGSDALARLPACQPLTVVDLSSIRSAKTMMSVCRAIRASQIVDVGALKRGEVPRIPIVSVTLSRARVAFRMLRSLTTESPVLRGLLIDETQDTITLRHPTGRPVEIQCVAGSRAASGFVGDWCAGLIADEAPRQLGREEGVANLADILSAVRGRLLPGAQIQLIGSPWAPSGPVYDLTESHFGKPSASMVVLRSTGPQNNPSHFTPEFCEALREADPVAYQTDVLGEFADPETSLLDPASIRHNTREGQLIVPREHGAKYYAGMDQSSGLPGKNSWTLVIIRKIKAQGHATRFQVVLAKEWRAGGPRAILQECAIECSRYGVHIVQGDAYSGSANVDLARLYGLTLVPEQSSTAQNTERYTAMATLMHTDCLEVPDDKQFRRDLMAIKKRATRDGYRIHLPITPDGRHTDYAPALASALDHANHNESIDREALERRGRQLVAQWSGSPTPTHEQWPESAWTTINPQGVNL